MLLQPLLALFALPLCFALSTEESHAELVKAAAAGNGVIKLDDYTYDLLTAPDRTWSAAIGFSALDPRRKCGPCKQFQPSFNDVARAWTKVPAAERNQHFFASADFDDTMTLFQKLGIQSAPILYMYPAAEGYRKPANGKLNVMSYDFTQGYEAQPLADHLSQLTPVRIPYSAPIDWTKYGVYAAGVLVFATTLRFVLPLLQSRWVWALGTVATTLIMTGGHMFVRIRGMPYSDGGNWIAAGYQNQYGQETQVVALTYGLLGAAFCMLTMVAPYQTSPKRQQLQIWLWSAVIFFMFSVLVSLFRVKNRGYPFKLLF